MDWLAEILAKNYAARIEDQDYLKGKRAELSKMDRLQAIREISALDGKGRSLLCEELEVSPADLDAFLRVLRAL